MSRSLDKYALLIGDWGLTIMVSLMPFHAFLVIWAGHLFGYQVYFQAWKEILTILIVLVAAWHMWHRRSLLERLFQPAAVFAIIFIIWAVLVSLMLHQAGTSSWWYGLKTDVEFMVLFLAALVLANKALGERLAQFSIIAGVCVAVIGLLQAFILPSGFWEFFGYSVATILPLQTISASSQIRVFSTLGGPNQLGAFLIIPTMLVLAKNLREQNAKRALLLGVLILAIIMTFSRSAWLGLIVASLVLMAQNLKRYWRAGIVIGLSSAVALTLLASSKHINLQTYLLHGRDNGGISASDQERLSAYSQGLDRIRQRPLGYGLGSAGPASFKNPRPLITENYYLQLAVETGLVGLGLFMLWIVFMGLGLWKIRSARSVALPLFASLVGISVVNFFLHGWADSTFALVFASLAGTTLGDFS